MHDYKSSVSVWFMKETGPAAAKLEYNGFTLHLQGNVHSF